MKVKFQFIPKEDILSILPLVKLINDYTPEDKLKERILEMSNQHYKCVGVYFEEELIGISGLWFLTRHYAGKTIEPDHVVIKEAYRNKGIGNQLFDWIHQYAKDNGHDATELNTFIENLKSHKFYENQGYKKLGLHFVKKI